MLPKVSQMASGLNERSRPIIDVPAPHVVITCPSCNTSFAVETAAVAALDTPKFHCSRCDDVFIMRDAPRASGFKLQSLSRYSAKGGSTPVNRSEPPPAGAHDPLLRSSDFSLISQNSHGSPLLENESTTQGTGSPRLHRSEDDRQAVAPAGSLLERPPPSGFTISEAGVEERTLVAQRDREAQAPRRFVLSDAELGAPPAGAHRGDGRTKAPQLEPRGIQPLRPPARRPSDGVDAQSRFSPRTQSLISMSTPILTALLVLLALSYTARISPESLDAVANFTIPSFAKGAVQELPPQTLSVRGLSLSFQKTRNRETTAVVSGSVVNQGGYTLEGLEIEALGFSERGEVILSSRAPLRSTLADRKVSQLSMNEISAIQTQPIGDGDAISSRDTIPFSIALLDAKQHAAQDGVGQERVDPSKIRYFSARVFSVRQRD